MVDWVGFAPAVDSKIRKTRPDMIVSNNSSNRKLSRMIVVPPTSNTDRLYPGEAHVSAVGKATKAMAGQLITADKTHLTSRIDVLSKAELLAVELAMREKLSLPIQFAIGSGPANRADREDLQLNF